MSMTLGELKGQMREIVHQLNNMSSKMDAISHEISKNSGIPEEVEKLKLRVAALEEKESKREGAMGLGVWIMRSPLLGWLAGAVLAGWGPFGRRAQGRRLLTNTLAHTAVARCLAATCRT